MCFHSRRLEFQEYVRTRKYSFTKPDSKLTIQEQHPRARDLLGLLCFLFKNAAFARCTGSISHGQARPSSRTADDQASAGSA